MIWKRYFLKELAKIFFLFIGGFYFLYVLIDYSAHTKTFNQEGIHAIDIVLYYLFQLTKRADVLFPIALLIAVIKVLTTLSLRHETVALVSAGVPLKTLMRPFLLAGAFCAFLLYLNFQFLQPLSLTALSSFEDSFFKERSTEEPIGSLPLTDNSLLIYQKYQGEEKAFFDVYWFKNPDLIYRIQTFYPYEKIPFGKHIDLLKRAGGELTRTDSFDFLEFPEIHFDPKSLFTAVHPPRLQSLTQLFSNLSWKIKQNDREAETATVFIYKLMIPLTCLLVVFAPAPFCLRFDRHLPIFLTYALCLFGIISFFTFVNSCVILGESQVISPLWALLIPFTLYFGIFGWKYAKL